MRHDQTHNRRRIARRIPDDELTPAQIESLNRTLSSAVGIYEATWGFCEITNNRYNNKTVYNDWIEKLKEVEKSLLAHSKETDCNDSTILGLQSLFSVMKERFVVFGSPLSFLVYSASILAKRSDNQGRSEELLSKSELFRDLFLEVGRGTPFVQFADNSLIHAKIQERTSNYFALGGVGRYSTESQMIREEIIEALDKTLKGINALSHPLVSELTRSAVEVVRNATDEERKFGVLLVAKNPPKENSVSIELATLVPKLSVTAVPKDLFHLDVPSFQSIDATRDEAVNISKYNDGYQAFDWNFLVIDDKRIGVHKNLGEKSPLFTLYTPGIVVSTEHIHCLYFLKIFGS